MILGDILKIAVSAAAIAVVISYICWHMAFFVPKSKPADFYNLPEGKQYSEYSGTIFPLIESASKIPYEDVYITSHDGYRLRGRLYAGPPGAPVEIMFHGYRSRAYTDFCGGLLTALDMGHGVILVDQRAHDMSGGRCLSFGVLERLDCLSWVNYSIERFGCSSKVILVGVSMGASTVLMASGLSLPNSVVGIIADSGYTSAKEIIMKVAKEKRLPPHIVYPFVRLGAIIFGGFDPNSCSADKALASCSVPVMFIHGENDRFVPCDMSRRNCAVCASPASILTVPGADHGMSYIIDNEAYRRSVDAFKDHILKINN